MVARIHIAIELHHTCMSAMFGERTHTGLNAHPVGKCRVEHLNVEFPHIFFDPLIEKCTEKFSPLYRFHREVSQFGNFVGSRKFQTVGSVTNSLHDRRKLYVPTIDLFEKIVEFERIIGIKIVHHGHCIKFHAMFFEQINAFHNLHKSGLTTFVAAIFVVKLLRAIDRNTHQKIVFFEKFAPGIVKQCSVGLNYIVNFTSASVFFLKFEGFFVEANRT